MDTLHDTLHIVITTLQQPTSFSVLPAALLGLTMTLAMVLATHTRLSDTPFTINDGVIVCLVFAACFGGSAAWLVAHHPIFEHYSAGSAVLGSIMITYLVMLVSWAVGAFFWMLIMIGIEEKKNPGMIMRAFDRR